MIYTCGRLRSQSFRLEGEIVSLVVIVPSRGRPHSVAGLAEAFVGTTHDRDTRLWIAVDSDDPDLGRYRDAVDRVDDPRVTVTAVLGGYMSVALNEAATAAVGDPTVDAVGFMGDDHRPRTGGWDIAYRSALAEMGGAGIVYGDDGLQSEALPTQCAMSASIVRTLGWMCPPVLRHLWIDNFWLDLGRAAGCLRYLPGIVVEHMHPYNGKAEMDAGYERVNSTEMIDADKAAYERYVAKCLDRDVEMVRALRG
jgi:hypothetical protein